MEKDKNGIPYIKVPVYYIIDDNGRIIYDIDEMTQEFNKQIDLLPLVLQK